MKCGILVIGSLLWDSETDGRVNWRNTHLDIGRRMPVKAPIYYGRKSRSRGNTFTMTLRSDDPSGVAILVPCQLEIETIDDLVVEAGALWKAEAPTSAPGAIGSGWGCVGALLGSDRARKSLAALWSNHFREVGAKGLSIVKPDGHLDIGWPSGAAGEVLDIDIILATATVPDARLPTVDAVADAWIDQDGGHERYFLENVRHGIRTEADLEIWSHVERAAPYWLTTDAYSDVITMLRSETLET